MIVLVIEVGEDKIKYTSTTWLFSISKIPHNSLYLFGEVASAITNANGCKYTFYINMYFRFRFEPVLNQNWT